jgi:L-asparaginase
MKIKIYSTGGSIDKVYSTRDSALVVGEPKIARILEEASAGIAFQVEPLLRKDSLEITDQDRALIVQVVRSDPHRHVIITHGTDSMVDTAKALAGIPGKVIILTGAMQPAAFKTTDAAFNVGGAVIAAQVLPEGVHIVMAGQIFDPHTAVKNPALDRFEEMS